MTLYTSLPIELVMQGIEDEVEPMQEIWALGVKMQIMPIAPGKGKIVRLLECKLDDYLNPNLSPGMIVQYGIQEG